MLPLGVMGSKNILCSATHNPVVKFPTLLLLLLTDNTLQTLTRGAASAEEPHDALRQLKYYCCFVTELLTTSFANAEEPCEHTVS